MDVVTPEMFTNVINSYLPEPHASLLNGIILGIPLKTDPQFNADLKTAGIVHIVVLSGANISFLISLITTLTSFLGKKISTVISIATICGFIAFVGFQAPIVRAGIMGILVLLGSLWGRKTLALYLLALSGIISLLIWPEWLTSISFQLSYAATTGLIIFSKIPVPTSHQNMLSTFCGYLKEELHISLAAQAFTAPLIFFYFKQISFISPFTNIVISWVMGPLMIMGLCTAFLGKIHNALGVVPAYLSMMFLEYVITVTRLFAKIPFAAVQF